MSARKATRLLPRNISRRLTIVDNTNYGIHNDGWLSPIIKNNIVWGNGDDLWGVSSVMISYCDIEDGDFAGTNGNISLPPVFVDQDGTDNIPGTEDDDYRIQASSPCINAGTCVGAPPYDIDGDCRCGWCNPPETSCDIGADEVEGDNDGILDDGDNSGIPGDNPCTGGATLNCDDNCPEEYNPNQTDSNGDGIGDVCDPSVSSITVTSPTAGEDWVIGTTETIRWTSSGVSGNVEIKLGWPSGCSYNWSTIAEVPVSNGSYDWTVQEPAKNNCKIGVCSSENSGICGESGLFDIVSGDTTSPIVSVSHSPSSPNVGDTITFTADASDESGISYIEIYLDGSSLGSCSYSNACSKTWTATAGSHTYYAKAWDDSPGGGNEGTSSTGSFTTGEGLDPPTGLTSQTLSDTSIKWDWNDVSGADSYLYFLYSDSSCSNYITAGAPTESYATETGLSPGTTYSLEAAACNTEALICSEYSVCVAGTTSAGDTTSPSVSMSYSPSWPYVGDTVTFTADASDESGISYIEIYLDGSLLGSCIYSNPCTKTWVATGTGDHFFYAAAWDDSPNGNVGSSYQWGLTVNPPPPNPPILASPSDGYGNTTRNILFDWHSGGDNGGPIDQYELVT